MRHRLDAVEVERLDVGRMIEDRRELIGVVLELVVGQVEAREARHMGDLLGGDALRHGLSCYGTQSRARAAFSFRKAATVGRLSARVRVVGGYGLAQSCTGLNAGGRFSTKLATPSLKSASRSDWRMRLVGLARRLD